MNINNNLQNFYPYDTPELTVDPQQVRVQEGCRHRGSVHAGRIHVRNGTFAAFLYPAGGPMGFGYYMKDVANPKATDFFGIGTPPNNEGPPPQQRMMTIRVQPRVAWAAVVPSKIDPDHTLVTNSGPTGYGYYQATDPEWYIVNFFPVDVPDNVQAPGLHKTAFRRRSAIQAGMVTPRDMSNGRMGFGYYRRFSLDPDIIDFYPLIINHAGAQLLHADAGPSHRQLLPSTARPEPQNAVPGDSLRQSPPTFIKTEPQD